MLNCFVLGAFFDGESASADWALGFDPKEPTLKTLPSFEKKDTLEFVESSRESFSSFELLSVLICFTESTRFTESARLACCKAGIPDTVFTRETQEITHFPNCHSCLLTMPRSAQSFLVGFAREVSGTPLATK